MASNGSKVERPVMYEIDVNEQVRELCQQILEEKDPPKVQQLVAALRSTVQAGQDEARLRMSYVARHYRGRLQAVSHREGAQQLGQGARRIRALRDFLGLGSGMRLGREMEG